MDDMADTHDLSMMLDAHVPIVSVQSPDERRVLDLLTRLATARNLPLYEWSVTRGLRKRGYSVEAPRQPSLKDPEELLAHIGRTTGPAIYALCDFHPYLKDNPTVIRSLKDIALDYGIRKNTLVFISHSLSVPAEIGRMTASFALRLPSDEELMAIVRSNAQEWSERHRGKRVKTDSATLEKFIANLRGVTHADAQVLIRHAVFNDGAISDSDIPEVNKLKFDLLDAEGVLRFEYDTHEMADVAGLDNLKDWLHLRRNAFLEDNEDRPKGILLLGVQGGGKSLAAKAVAGHWGLPLLRLDFGTLYNKYYGETERNLRNSLNQAELMAPCVLWIDEIEKGLSVGSSDNATSARVLGSLLTWMAEHNKGVFIVATANDVSGLPPEIMRKGRIDEVFFVDLPNGDVRREIFRIHLQQRDLNPQEFNLDELATVSDGFTGAEIEQAIVSARYLCASQERIISTADVLEAIHRTYPISVLRGDAIDALRAWARDRTVPA